MPRKSYRVRFDGGNGFPLAGIVDRPDDADSFPCVVFSHCFTCNKDLKAIVRISRALADAGIAVLRFDMTGLGGSDGDFSETNFSTNVADLKAAIAFAGEQLAPVTALVGHSFGGAASLLVASEIPAVRALVTLAAPSDTRHLAELLSQLNPEIERVGRGSVTIGGIEWLIRREMLADFRIHDLPAAIARIRIPTLVFHSPVDATVGFDHALRIAGLVNGGSERPTPVSLIAVHDSDHLLADRNDDLVFVAGTVAAFVRRYANPM